MEAESARLLRDGTRRAVGTPLGTVAAHPSQNAHLALPLALPGACARLLLARGLAQASPSDADAATEAGDAAYGALWARGMWVSGGAKFGCTWMAYAGDPLRFHAACGVAVARLAWPPDGQPTARDLAGFARVCAAANKTALVADEDDDEGGGGASFVAIEWRG